jgi:hypothetical protein
MSKPKRAAKIMMKEPRGFAFKAKSRLKLSICTIENVKLSSDGPGEAFEKIMMLKSKTATAIGMAKAFDSKRNLLGKKSRIKPIIIGTNIGYSKISFNFEILHFKLWTA